MTRAQQKRFKNALEARRTELMREIAECRERLAIDPEADAMDHLRSTADRDFAIQSIGRMKAAQHLVERALQEIRDRTFGVCAQCGEAIPLKRLEAVPWSPYCVTCQENREQSIRSVEPTRDEAFYALAS